jgi:hypothetical protein
MSLQSNIQLLAEKAVAFVQEHRRKFGVAAALALLWYLYRMYRRAMRPKALAMAASPAATAPSADTAAAAAAAPAALNSVAPIASPSAALASSSSAQASDAAETFQLATEAVRALQLPDGVRLQLYAYFKARRTYAFAVLSLSVFSSPQDSFVPNMCDLSLSAHSKPRKAHATLRSRHLSTSKGKQCGRHGVHSAHSTQLRQCWRTLSY